MDRTAVAQELAKHHVVVEDEIVLAVQYVRTGGDNPGEPIKLLEVNRSTVPAGVQPVFFGATKDYPSVVIIEVTEEEYSAIQRGQAMLPEGWDDPIILHQRAA